MDIDFQIDFTDSWYRKTSPESLLKSCEEAIRETATDLEEECKNESPVRTGNLRDGHYVKVEGLNATVYNTMDYAPYVVYGTSKQSPNNYPQRAINKIIGSGVIPQRITEKLRENNIL